MRGNRSGKALALMGLAMVAAVSLTGQPAVQSPAQPAQTGAQGGRGNGGRRGAGGFGPGQQRPPGDPEQIARGKTLYGISCTGCHGADLRGGDLGGPNLLRSQVALSDQDSELIL